MKTILFFQSSLEYGGVRTVSEILSESFLAIGYRVVWLVGHRYYNDHRDYEKKIKTIYLPDDVINSQTNVEFYRNCIRENYIDYVINQDGLFDSIDLIATTGNTNTLVINVIHSNPKLNYNWLWHDALQIRGHKLVDYCKLIARMVLYPRTKRRAWQGILAHTLSLQKQGNPICVLSASYKQELSNIFSPIEPLITAIPNPLRYTSEDSVDLGKKGKSIIYVGRLDNRSKKLFTLLSIWKAVQHLIPDWNLKIIGDGPDRAVLEKKSERLSNVQFLGFREPQIYYKEASILCMTSMYEGFPMTLIEAMQNGCVPILFDSFPAARDIVENGENGILIKPFRKMDFARELVRLATDANAVRQMAERAQSYVEKYSLSKIVPQWLSLFENYSRKSY